MRMKICPDMTATPPESLTAWCVVLDSFQRRRWAPLSGWLTVTQILKPNDCWHCFLRSLTLKGPFQGSAKSIFFFIFFLGVCVSYIFFFSPTSNLIVLSFLRVHPWPQIEGDLVRGWTRAAVAELNGAHQSPRLQWVRGCVRGERKVIGGWWRMVGGRSGRRPGDLKASGSN